MRLWNVLEQREAVWALPDDVRDFGRAPGGHHTIELSVASGRSMAQAVAGKRPAAEHRVLRNSLCCGLIADFGGGSRRGSGSRLDILCVVRHYRSPDRRIDMNVDQKHETRS
jgi:hypothetical protein